MIFLFTLILATTAPRCGVNEKQLECAPEISCQPSCDQPAGRQCPRMCSLTPCVCEKGFIRASSDNETCIEKTKCNECKCITSFFFALYIFFFLTAATIRSIICGENEKYTHCATPCQPWCEQSDQELCETVECVGNCVCKKGYFRATNNITSPCIKCATK
jgi:hypothetical protein